MSFPRAHERATRAGIALLLLCLAALSAQMGGPSSADARSVQQAGAKASARSGAHRTVSPKANARAAARRAAARRVAAKRAAAKRALARRRKALLRAAKYRKATRTAAGAHTTAPAKQSAVPSPKATPAPTAALAPSLSPAAPAGAGPQPSPASEDSRAAATCDWYASLRCDPVTRAVSDLRRFTSWLNTYGVKGYIGEVGWPKAPSEEAAKWGRVGEAWYQEADRAGLWVTAWAATSWWNDVAPLSIYQPSRFGGPLDSPTPTATVVERHPTANGVLRGIDLGGGDSNAPGPSDTSSFSNANPGVYGRDYQYESTASLQYLASRGIKVVRIGFRWERIQPIIGGPLDATEMSRLRGVVERAADAGLRVILDLHNYGGYMASDGTHGVRRTIGTGDLPLAALADMWRQLATSMHDEPGVLGYDLMNEPAELTVPSGDETPARLWERASQAALDAIRATGDTRTVLVPGYNYSGVTYWALFHPRAWIVDPANNFRYEAHQYFDIRHTGLYPLTYDAELAQANIRADV